MNKNRNLPTINREIEIYPAEHQVFLEFRTTKLAQLFLDWLDEMGSDSFLSYVRVKEL